MTQTWLVTIVALNAVLTLLLALSIVFLYRQWGAIVLRGAEGISTHHGLRTGSIAPPLNGASLTTGQTITIEPRHRVLVFATPGCSACQELAPVFRDFTLAQDAWPLTYISTGEPEALSGATREHLLTGADLQVLVSADESAHDSYEVSVSPFVMVVDDTGRIASKGLIGQLSDLVELVVQSGDLSMMQLRNELIEGTIVIDGVSTISRGGGDEVVSRRPSD